MIKIEERYLSSNNFHSIITYSCFNNLIRQFPLLIKRYFNFNPPIQSRNNAILKATGMNFVTLEACKNLRVAKYRMKECREQRHQHEQSISKFLGNRSVLLLLPRFAYVIVHAEGGLYYSRLHFSDPYVVIYRTSRCR